MSSHDCRSRAHLIRLMAKLLCTNRSLTRMRSNSLSLKVDSRFSEDGAEVTVSNDAECLTFLIAFGAFGFASVSLHVHPNFRNP